MLLAKLEVYMLDPTAAWNELSDVTRYDALALSLYKLIGNILFPTVSLRGRDSQRWSFVR